MSDSLTTTSSFTLPPPVALAARRSARLPANLMIGAAIIALVVCAALLSFLWTPFDATRIVIAERFLGPGVHGHLLGTDQFGRDLFSQIMVGSRNELFVGVIAVSISLFIGVPLGGLAAMRGGWLQELVLRASDILYAFPALLLAIMFGAVFTPSTLTAMVAIGLAYIPVFARLTRSASLKVLQEDFILAARACGTSRLAIFLRHVMRNIAAVVIVQATVAFALAILAEAALSYLGLATQPPTPSWGRMLSQAQDYLTIAPLLALWPGLAIAFTVLGFNLLGDGLRDTLDPRLEVYR